jgi:hypothetical protein
MVYPLRTNWRRRDVGFRLPLQSGRLTRPLKAGGLKLDLDRFRHDVDDIVRETKKDAEGFIARAKEEIAAAELDEDED